MTVSLVGSSLSTRYDFPLPLAVPIKECFKNLVKWKIIHTKEQVTNITCYLLPPIDILTETSFNNKKKYLFIN